MHLLQRSLVIHYHHISRCFSHGRALEGGRIVFGVQGTFDTLNPYSVRGIAAQGVASW